MSREREVKMIVADSFELPDLHDAVEGAFAGDVEEREISDVYYDTIDLRLARWGCTMRERAGEGWTVKIPRPSKGIVLDREEVVFRDDPGDPPVAALKLVSSLTRGVDVDVVARLRTRRLVRTWRTDDGGSSPGSPPRTSRANDRSPSSSEPSAPVPRSHPTSMSRRCRLTRQHTR